MRQATHHGRETAYRLTGPSEATDRDAAVCYVHGSGGDHSVWAAQYGPEGPARPAAALDLSGHGASEDVETDSGSDPLTAYARDVVAVARETGADVLVGNSLGGAVVLWVALETPFDPAALVLAGTGGTLPVHEDLREWLADDFERAVEFLHAPDRLFHDPDERTLARSRAVMRETGQQVTERDFRVCHRFDVRDRLGEIAVPALALAGEHDGLTPPRYHESLAADIPDCEYGEISGAAHLAMVERPGAFCDAVGAFLGERGLAPE